MTFVTGLILALAAAAATGQQCRWTCFKDKCKGTWTNPLPRGKQWYKWAQHNPTRDDNISDKEFWEHPTNQDLWRAMLVHPLNDIFMAQPYGCCWGGAWACDLCCPKEKPTPAPAPPLFDWTPPECSEEFGCGEDRAVSEADSPPATVVPASMARQVPLVAAAVLAFAAVVMGLVAYRKCAWAETEGHEDALLEVETA